MKKLQNKIMYIRYFKKTNKLLTHALQSTMGGFSKSKQPHILKYKFIDTNTSTFSLNLHTSLDYLSYFIILRIQSYTSRLQNFVESKVGVAWKSSEVLQEWLEACLDTSFLKGPYKIYMSQQLFKVVASNPSIIHVM